ncbi:hypothetical protein ACNKHM_16975 [Shigella sonnei]
MQFPDATLDAPYPAYAATHPVGLIRCASIASGVVLQPLDPAYRLMQHRHRVFQSAGAVFHHRRHLRTLFHQLGVFWVIRLAHPLHGSGWKAHRPVPALNG